MYLFIDSDFSIVPSSAVSMLSKIPLQSQLHSNFGFLIDYTVLHNEDQNPGPPPFTVSENEIPWTIYPPYSSGQAYMVGAELLIDASIAMAFTRYFRIDDAYLGFVWTKLGSRIDFLMQLRDDIPPGTKSSDVLTARSRFMDAIMDWSTGRFKTKGLVESQR